MTMDEDERRKWDLLSENVKKMQDALLVYSTMTLHHEERIKEHEEWLRQNELAAARHMEFTAQHEAMMQRIDRNIELLSELILKGRSTNGNPPQ